MNKTELIAAIADQAELSKKDSEKALKAFIDVVTEELKKEHKVQVVGFGTFEVSMRAEREGRNPQTGETMKIALVGIFDHCSYRDRSCCRCDCFDTEEEKTEDGCIA